MSFLTISKLKINSTDKLLVDLLKVIQTPLTLKHSLALVGQSGSGKSITLKSILGLLPFNLSSKFDYKSDFDLKLDNIGFIPQNPFTSLSPMTKIKKQFFQPDNIIDNSLKTVGLDINTKDKFPSQLSGGQLQRVVIAIILAKKPKLLLLDEPTTALDSANKKLILDLLRNLQDRFGFLMIFISHDIESVKTIVKDIAIVKDGSIIEYGSIDNIITNPQQQYTKVLLNSNFINRKFRV